MSLYENLKMSKSGRSVTIAVFDDTQGPESGDLITFGERGQNQVDKVKDSGNMGTYGEKKK